jgi:hypothetical protein
VAAPLPPTPDPPHFWLEPYQPYILATLAICGPVLLAWFTSRFKSQPENQKAMQESLTFAWTRIKELEKSEEECKDRLTVAHRRIDTLESALRDLRRVVETRQGR